MIFHIYFQVAFSDDFWVWIWVSGIGKPSIWQGRYCKNQLLQKLDFSWFPGQFSMILGGLGTNFHSFCCPGDWLENWWFFMVILGSPQILRPSWWRVNLSSPGPKPLNRNLETGDMRHEKWEISLLENPKCENTRLKRNPSQPGAPLRGAGG